LLVVFLRRVAWGRNRHGRTTRTDLLHAFLTALRESNTTHGKSTSRPEFLDDTTKEHVHQRVHGHTGISARRCLARCCAGRDRRPAQQPVSADRLAHCKSVRRLRYSCSSISPRAYRSSRIWHAECPDLKKGGPETGPRPVDRARTGLQTLCEHRRAQRTSPVHPASIAVEHGRTNGDTTEPTSAIHASKQYLERRETAGRRLAHRHPFKITTI
jgi:hypothetical protein